MTSGETSSLGGLPEGADGASSIEDAQPRLRIFISSPSDVRPERLIAERVVRRLDREFSASVRVQAVMWEREPLLATHHFQTTITKPHDTDIVVVILWSSLGTPLPADEFRGALSAEQVTGTVWEFEDAVEAYRAGGRPKVLMYRKRAKVTEALDDRAAVQRRMQQLDEVDAFFKRWFVDKSGLLPSNASREFDSAAAFEDMLEDHLRGLIETHIRTVGGATAGPKRTYHDNPFRGLLSFELKDSSVFFGRTRARNELRELLARRARSGSAFVLAFGASGSGKSSLVKAGLLADLVLPGMIGRVALVRHATLRPSDRRGALLEALAAAIIESKDALPELGAPPFNDTVAGLAKLLREAPSQAARPIRQGLSAAGQAAGLDASAEARLVLAIDQLEELFTLDDAAAAERELFVAALAALAQSGLVWVIATMRSDFFDRLELLPSLAVLSEGEARFLLLPPGAAEIGQIVRQPAREAGLRYEIDPSSKVGLDEIIRQDALHSNDGAPSTAASKGEEGKTETNQAVPHGALPLLSFVLDQLWRRRTDDGVLTFEAYRELGGLKGAIGRRGEEVYLAQPPEVQNEFVPVLRELVTVTSGIATARSAPLAGFAKGTPGRALVDALLDKDARLLVADGGSGGSAAAQVRLAHEALLTHWPRARDQVASDARDLELRGRLEQEAARWRAAAPRDKKSLVRPTGLPLAEALALQARWGKRLPDIVSDFIRASRRAALHRRLRLGGIVAAAAAALPLIAAVVWAAWVWSGVRAVEAAMKFVTIPAGCFDMGSPLDDEERAPNEGVDGVATGFCLKSFELGTYEVTQDEWRQVMLHVSTPSSFSGPRNPVESVSWDEAETFVRLMSLFGKYHYRLASEAQWEYAARGRTTPGPYVRRYWGDRAEDGCTYENTSDLKLHARYRDYPYSKCEDGYVNTAPVGSLKPNPFGVYDMLGNVGEWVEDCFVPDLRQLPKDGSPAEQANCPRRVIRGGSWGESAFRMRAANRVVVEGGHRDNFYGFRIIRAP